MSNMEMLGVNCNVVYVDTTALSGSNDGISISGALTSFPLYNEIEDDTVYLLRRTDSIDLEVISNTSITKSNVFFIGMPLTTEPIYEYLPTEAKGTSWDSDPEEFATLFFTRGDYAININGCDNFGFHRIKFIKEDDTYQTANNTTANVCVIGTNQGNGFVNKCKSETFGRDFSDPGYVDDLQNRYIGLTFTFKNFNMLNIKNNKFVRTGSISYAQNNYGMLFEYIVHLYIEDNIFWQGSSNIAHPTYTFSPFILYVGTEIDFCVYNNNKVFYYGNHGASHNHGMVHILSYNIIARNNTFEFSKFSQAPTTLTAGYSKNSYLFSYNGYDANANLGQCTHIIEDLYVDTRGSLVIQGNVPLVSIHFLNSSSNTLTDQYFSIGPESILKNITVLTDKEYDCVAESGGGQGLIIYAPHQYIENILVDNDTRSSHAFYIHSAGLVEKVNVFGKLYVNSASFVDVEKLTYNQNEETTTITDSVINNIGSLVRIKEVEFTHPLISLKWLKTTQQDSTSSSKTIIENCNNIDIVDHSSGANTSTAYGVWMNNLKDLDGNWMASNYYYDSVVWGVRRNEGLDASIKLSGDKSDIRIPLRISPSYHKGFGKVPNIAIGVVKFYFAFKLMANLTLFDKRIKVDIEVNNNSTEFPGKIETNTISSINEGIWEDDLVSTWTEPGLVKKVLKLPFVTNRTSDLIAMRLYYDWYDTNGYTYFDPYIDIE